MSTVLAKIKSYFTYTGEDDYEEYDEYEEMLEEQPVSKKRNNVVSIHPNANMRIVLYEPLEYEDATTMATDLKLGKTIIVNLSLLEKDVKDQIFYFLTGAIYSLEGKFQKISRDIFILSPGCVEIEGVKDELKNKGVFLW